jgi:hypothetical protein
LSWTVIVEVETPSARSEVGAAVIVEAAGEAARGDVDERGAVDRRADRVSGGSPAPALNSV